MDLIMLWSSIGTNAIMLLLHKKLGMHAFKVSHKLVKQLAIVKQNS